jgi:hypothetical protein
MKSLSPRTIAAALCLVALAIADVAPSRAQDPLGSVQMGMRRGATTSAPCLYISGNSPCVSFGTYNNATGIFVPKEPTGSFNIGSSGAVGDGTADDTGKFQSLLTSVAASGGELFLPCGKYKITAAITATIAAGKSMRIRGISSECVTLYFTAGGGFSIGYGSPFSSIHVNDVSVTTGGNGTGNPAFNLSYKSAYGNPALTAQNDFTNVVVRGDDAYNGANYWTQAYNVTQVSNINWIGGAIYGSSTAQGDGVILQGSAARSSFGVAYNLTGGIAIVNTNVAVTYGSWVQGVILNTVNISNGATGVYVPPGEVGLHGLNLTNVQIGVKGSSIDIRSNIGGVGVVNSLFEAEPNVCALNLVGTAGASIVANQFNGNTGDSTHNNYGVCLSGSGGLNSIASNTFGAFAVGISVSGAGQVFNSISGDNTYNTVGTNVLDTSTSTRNGYQYLANPIFLGTTQFAVNSGGYNTLVSGDGSNQSIFLGASNTLIRGPNVIFSNFGGSTTYGTLDANRFGLTSRLNTPLHTPASSSEACVVGDAVDDASFHYVCTATNTWKRVALSSF